MPSVNEVLLDEAIRHAVDFQRYSTGTVYKMVALLNRVDPDLIAAIARALERMPTGSFTVDRLERLLSEVRNLNAQAYESIGREMPTEMRDLVAHEAGYQKQLFEATLPQDVVQQVSIAGLHTDQVFAAVMARPFQGTLLRESLQGLEAGRSKLIRDAIRIGYVENQTTQQIIQRIRGTRARGYADGLLEAPRRHIESVVRTALSHTAGYTRQKFYEANDDIIAGVRWLSTIDSHTTLKFCIPRDGKLYTVEDHKPIGHKLPWGSGPGQIHWCCRSTSTAVTKSWMRMGLDGESLSGSSRASVDGQIPAEITYPQWLKRQSASMQDDVLGPARGALFRRGEVNIESFFNERGRLLTLEEMAARNQEAFTKANVSP